MLRWPSIFITALGLAAPVLGQGPAANTYRSPAKNPALEKRIDNLKKAVVENSGDLNARMELGEIYLNQDRPAEVIVYLKPSLENLPHRGLMILAKAYAQKSDYLNEIRILNRILSEHESDYLAETMLGQAYSGDKKSVDAVKHYRNSISINPRYKEAYWGLLKEFEAHKNNYEKRELMEQMHSTFGDEPDVMEKLCAIYTVDGYIDDGITTCEKAVELNPTHPENHVNLGLNHKYRKDKDAAKRILYQAAKQFSNSDIAQCAAGDIAKENSDSDGAVAFFKRGATINPKSLPCQLGLAKSAFEIGDYQSSLKAYVAACQMNRKYSLDIRQAAGYLRQKKLDEWKEKFIAAVGKCD